MANLVDLLDDAGSSLAELAASPVSSPKAASKTLHGLDEAMTGLEEAKGIAEGLAGVAPKDAKTQLLAIATLINDGMDSVTQAERELGPSTEIREGEAPGRK